MMIGPVELVFILVALGATVVLPIWGLVDAATRPDAVWAASGQSKVVWLILQVLLWTLGALIYFIAIRPKLVAASAARPPEAV
jgi:predicted membrane channel-forming protein YqfA (hemolysin III family)